MYDVVTCPKCKTRVLPKQDGTCPNCHSKIKSGKERKISLSTKSENLKRKSSNSMQLTSSPFKNKSTMMVNASNEVQKSSREKAGGSKSQSRASKTTTKTAKPHFEKSREVRISNQVQCPNCGGYKITSAEKPIKEKVPTPILQRVTNGVLGLALIGLGLYIYSIGLRSDISSDGGTIYAWTCGCPGALLLLVALFSSTQLKQVGKYYQFSCLLCGYSWEWREGQPWPKVKANPDLIAKGAQRLEEEDEEERKRQEALYHLSKLRKK